MGFHPVPSQLSAQLLPCHIWLYLGISGFILEDAEDSQSAWITPLCLISFLFFPFFKIFFFKWSITFGEQWNYCLQLLWTSHRNQCELLSPPHYSLLGKKSEFDKEQWRFWGWWLCITALDSLPLHMEVYWSHKFQVLSHPCYRTHQINSSQCSTASIGMLQDFPCCFFAPLFYCFV